MYKYQDEKRNIVIKSKNSNFDIIGDHILKWRYFKKLKNYCWIPAPSKRNHLHKTLKKINVEWCDLFTKTKDIKQKELSFEERKGIIKYLDKVCLPTCTNIVLIDDTTTTGATINAMIELLGNKYNISIVTFCINE